MSDDTIASEHKACADTCVRVEHGSDQQQNTYLTPEQRSLRASIAAHTSWAKTRDRAGRTAAARDARFQKWVDEAREIHKDYDVSEEFVLDVARHLQTAFMKRMALQSAKARAARKAADG